MDKIPEAIVGVRLLLPGIVVATIFYLYSNAKFSEVGFIIFCAIFVGLTGIALRIVVGSFNLGARLIGVVRGRIKTAMGGPTAGRATSDKNDRARELREGDTKVEKAASALPFIGELAIAVVLGLLLVKLYENDLSFRLVSSFMSTEKVTIKDTLDYVSDTISKKDWRRIDYRPENVKVKVCKDGSSECIDDVYVRIRLKADADIYEGAFAFYQSSGERLGMYLSPACVRRRLEPGKYDSLRTISGPGVYVNLNEMHTIEYWALEASECFKLYYPNYKTGSGH